MARFTNAALKDYLRLIEDVIAEGQEEGSLRADLPRKFLAKALFGVLDEMVTSWVLGDRNYDLVRLATPVVDLFLSGAMAKPSGPKALRKSVRGRNPG
jgi:TetR/AcrR family fatty acid metabolism transcriptional regulator